MLFRSVIEIKMQYGIVVLVKATRLIAELNKEVHLALPLPLDQLCTIHLNLDLDHQPLMLAQRRLG